MIIYTIWKLIKWTWKTLFSLVYIILAGIGLFLLACFNVFTLPFWLVCWLICRGARKTTPGLKHWYTLFYPSWEGRYTYYASGKVRNATSPVKYMSGAEFEQYCATLLKNKGMKNIVVTPGSGDYGADIVATDEHGIKWVFQCKRYNTRLGNSPIQEVIGSKAHYGAKKAGVMTNSTFTDKARLLALENDILLWEAID